MQHSMQQPYPHYQILSEDAQHTPGDSEKIRCSVDSYWVCQGMQVADGTQTKAGVPVGPASYDKEAAFQTTAPEHLPDQRTVGHQKNSRTEPTSHCTATSTQLLCPGCHRDMATIGNPRRLDAAIRSHNAPQ